MPKTVAPVHASTSVQLWKRLQSDAGLELKTKAGKRGRDADIEAAFIREFDQRFNVVCGRKTVLALMQHDGRQPSPKLTPQVTLELLLASQRGFSLMMQDVLETLVLAEASSSGQELRLKFVFDASSLYEATLSAFRVHEERTRQVLTRVWGMPSAELCWDVFHAVCDLLLNLPNLPKRTSPEADPDGFPVPLPLPPTGIAAVDAALRTLTRVIAALRADCRVYGRRDDRGFYHTLAAAGVRGELAQDAAGLASDHWDDRLLSELHTLASAVGAHPPLAARIKDQLVPLVDRMPSRQAWVDETYNHLLDMLKLPVWQQRHALYSVWVGTILMRCANLQADEFHFHVTAGVLSFDFQGSHLASYKKHGQGYEIWAELRSDISVHSDKRTQGIQPDFRVFSSGSAITDNDETVMVVEVKHYALASKSNFTQAVNDYAGTCFNAHVMLVNHGPADDTALRKAVRKPLRHRVYFFGMATPESEHATEALQLAFRSVLFPQQVAAQGAVVQAAALCLAGTQGGTSRLNLHHVPLSGDAIATIALHWTGALGDMDLSMEGNAGRVDFRQRGAWDRAPFACLRSDEQQGPATEVIDVTQWQGGRHVLIAENYRGDGDMMADNIGCVVLIGNQAWCFVPSCAIGPQEPWDIATVEQGARGVWVQPGPRTLVIRSP